MKIIDKREPRTTTFGELLIGDVFKLDTKYYMRIGNITTTFCVFNAVSLASALAHSFNDAMKVQKVNAAVIIGGEYDDD